MSANTLNRLRAADPARSLEAPAPEDLLARLVAQPRERHARRRRRAALAVPVAAAAAIGAFALLAPDVAPPDLTARAYAQTAAPAGEILYSRTTTRTSSNVAHLPQEQRAEERWQLGERWRTVARLSTGERFEEYLDADGVLHFTDGETARRSDGGDARTYIDERAPGFLREFRQAYERGTLDPAGDTTFNGRPARRYVVEWDRSRAEFFIDAEDGTPLGSRSELAIYTPDRKLAGAQTTVTVVEALKPLPATRENLNELVPDS